MAQSDSVSMNRNPSFESLSKQRTEEPSQFLKKKKKNVVWKVEAKWATEQGHSFLISFLTYEQGVP